MAITTAAPWFITPYHQNRFTVPNNNNLRLVSKPIKPKQSVIKSKLSTTILVYVTTKAFFDTINSSQFEQITKPLGNAWVQRISASQVLLALARIAAKFFPMYACLLSAKILLGLFPNLPWESRAFSLLRLLTDPYLHPFTRLVFKLVYKLGWDLDYDYDYIGGMMGLAILAIVVKAFKPFM